MVIFHSFLYVYQRVQYHYFPGPFFMAMLNYQRISHEELMTISWKGTHRKWAVTWDKKLKGTCWIGTVVLVTKISGICWSRPKSIAPICVQKIWWYAMAKTMKVMPWPPQKSGFSPWVFPTISWDNDGQSDHFPGQEVRQGFPADGRELRSAAQHSGEAALGESEGSPRRRIGWFRHWLPSFWGNFLWEKCEKWWTMMNNEVRELGICWIYIPSLRSQRN